MKSIRIKGLRKQYETYTALAGIDLDVEQGELLALLGPSGCGKSTTLQLLAGFDQPTSGEIWIGDKKLSAPGQVVPPERRNISLVFQSYAVWPHKTVAENVAYGLEVRRTPARERDERLKQALDMVRLTALRDRYPSELSGGQQQRVALARALVIEPSVLLLDEPLSNLDAHLREEMRFEIRRVHDLLGLTTVYVTHDQSEALVTADKIAVLKNGVIQQLDTPQNVYERPSNSFVATFIGANNELPGTLTETGYLKVGEQILNAENRSTVGSGGDVCLCIRPSRVKLTEPSNTNGPNVLRGKVKRVAYLGECSDVVVDVVTGHSVRAFVPPKERLVPGQEVDVHLPVSECQILDATKS
ncbi:iron(III) transport system ATP-binding protein [Paraburkholderia fungorum]|uniref:Iron(III) transport system ATP-binding protein n=1 Tax=Paraburkholderia fungorum TaxID=134537 RepID=A0A1H1JVP6_9BURK|nr:ABC transporter ATP-binding protein [Paraburkholderia fungorum]SDR53880.1 iron(III) transport system ATP-binding protein [Paraburkholderia fungorum]